MSRKRIQPSFIVGSLLVAYVLTIVPLPAAVSPLRPYWIAMVLIFWSIETPGRIGMGAGFVTGLGVDLLTGSLLGQHALGLVVLTFLTGKFRLRMRFFPLWQQALVVLAILVNDRVVMLWISGLAGEPLPDWRFWIPPVIAMVIWPWMFLLLDEFSQRFKARA